MTKQTKRTVKLALLILCGTPFVALLLLVVKFRSHTPNMALSSLAVALQNDDQTQIKRLSTPSGLITLQAMTSRYGQKRMGDYLSTHKSMRPTPHVFVTIVVFMLNDTKTPPVTAFFKWTWNGWKLISIHGTPTFQLPPNKALHPTGAAKSTPAGERDRFATARGLVADASKKYAIIEA